MDFIGTLTTQPWTSLFLASSKFLDRVLHKYATEGDTYGFITNNLITLGAFIYSQNPQIFNALENPDYLQFFRRYL